MEWLTNSLEWFKQTGEDVWAAYSGLIGRLQGDKVIGQESGGANASAATAPSFLVTYQKPLIIAGVIVGGLVVIVLLRKAIK